MNKLINPNIAQLEPYTPGKPLKELERELGITDAIKLASNENPIGASPLAVQAIQEILGEIHRYPDGGGYYLKKELAAFLGFNENQIILGNGSDEILSLTCHCFLNPGDEVIYGQPAFVEYELISKSFGARCIPVPLKNFRHDLSAMAAAVSPDTKLIFIANPNNPTGTMVNKLEFAAFIEKIPSDVIVVVDEAYYEFVRTNDFPASLDYVRQSRQIIVARTFSKAYGLAGLRVGYAVACPEIINYLNRVRPPFNVNILAQAAAIGALQDKAHLREVCRMVDEGRDYICRELNRLGVEYVPSVANFILLKVGNGREIYNKLLRKGVIVRAMEVYKLEQYVRVTIGTQAENERFIKALQQVLSA